MPVFERIAQVTLNANTATITFDSIPQTYEHLCVRGQIRLAYAAQDIILAWRANNDSGASSYSYFSTNAHSGSLFTQRSGAASYAYIGYMPGSTASANVFSGVDMEITDYSSTTKYKSYRYRVGYDRSGVGFQQFASGAYKGSTNAITRLDIGLALGGVTGDIAQYSTLALYGVRSSA